MSPEIAENLFRLIGTAVTRTASEYYRPRLNSLIHVLDLSFDALKLSSSKLTLVDWFKFRLAVKKHFPKHYDDMKLAMSYIREKHGTVFNAVVEDNKFKGLYIISTTYGKTQRDIAKILDTISHMQEFTARDKNNVLLANVGHIPGEELDALKSPLSVKIKAALKLMPLSVQQVAITKLKELYDAHKYKASYLYHRYDVDTAAKFNGILGKTTVLVTLQTFDRNNEFSTKIEKPIEAALRNYYTSQSFFHSLLNAPGSNTIKEDIGGLVVSILRGIKYIAPKHTKKPIIVKNYNIKTNTPFKAVKYSEPNNATRNLSTGRFSSVINLQALLNAHLHDVVAANMGDGEERRILNYRTGRFATSTYVDRVTISKEGAITAFYNYMKYPYATFSQGGQQQYPRSRDPKLLISKSIREIATKMGIERMRTVLV